MKLSLAANQNEELFFRVWSTESSGVVWIHILFSSMAPNITLYPTVCQSGWHTHTHRHTHNDLCMQHEKYLNINSINAAFEIERLTCKCINICGTYCRVWRARCNDMLSQAEAWHLLSSCGHKPRSHTTLKVRISGVSVASSGSSCCGEHTA